VLSHIAQDLTVLDVITIVFVVVVVVVVVAGVVITKLCLMKNR